MIFRQLFDTTSCTFSYLLARRRGAEALIIDPVLDQVDSYLDILEELDLRLVKAIDTHLHADHATGLGALRDQTRCVTVMGDQTSADVVGIRVREGDRLRCDGIDLEVIYTPGHTDDSYSFLFGDRVFTGDTLMIGGTGRSGTTILKTVSSPHHAASSPGEDVQSPARLFASARRSHHPRRR